MLLGKSYYHAPQGIGLAFDTERLHGYFNDLTGKTQWKGSLDADGIPVNKLADGTSCYFTTTIVQKRWDTMTGISLRMTCMKEMSF